MIYTALMADVVNSKMLLKDDREQKQIYIKACLEALNSIFRPSLEFDVIFSAGDEVQGLFRSPVAACLYLRLFKMLLSPLQLRAGIGAGEWDIRIPDGNSNEQDGSAYHNARNAILKAHERNNPSVFLISDSENDIFINTLLNVASRFEKNQSKYQKQVLLLMEVLYPFFDERSMDLNALKQISVLLDVRSESHISDDVEPFHVFKAYEFKKSVTPASTIKKGLSTRISNITNTSRQNMDNVIKTGNIAEIRSIDAVALLLIDRTFSEVAL